MLYLFIGGPIDGERHELSQQAINDGGPITVCDESSISCGDILEDSDVGTKLNTLSYYPMQLKDNGGSYVVFRSLANPIEALIKGYTKYCQCEGTREVYVKMNVSTCTKCNLRI